MKVARIALMRAAECRKSPKADYPQEQNLLEPAGVFVTLRCRGRLRGCIGHVGSDTSLVEVIARCAKAAAREDPRFDPVTARQVTEIDIELSVLSNPEDVAPSEVKAGQHGLVISKGWRRGILLPQVATEFRWTAERFLEETCIKAGLERDAWKHPDTRIQAFTAEIFSESLYREVKGKAKSSLRPNPDYSSST